MPLKFTNTIIAARLELICCLLLMCKGPRRSGCLCFWCCQLWLVLVPSPAPPTSGHSTSHILRFCGRSWQITNARAKQTPTPTLRPTHFILAHTPQPLIPPHFGHTHVRHTHRTTTARQHTAAHTPPQKMGKKVAEPANAYPSIGPKVGECILHYAPAHAVAAGHVLMHSSFRQLAVATCPSDTQTRTRLPPTPMHPSALCSRS